MRRRSARLRPSSVASASLVLALAALLGGGPASRSCSASSALIFVAAIEPWLRPRPRGVQAVGRVERGHEAGAPGRELRGYQQVLVGRADVRDGRQRGPDPGRPGIDVVHQPVAGRDRLLCRGRVGAVERRERSARRRPERFDLVGQGLDVGLGGVELPRHLRVARRRLVGPAGAAGRMVHGGDEPRRPERDDHDEHEPDDIRTADERRRIGPPGHRRLQPACAGVPGPGRAPGVRR